MNWYWYDTSFEDSESAFDWYYVQAKNAKEATKLLLQQGIPYCENGCQCCRRRKPNLNNNDKIDLEERRYIGNKVATGNQWIEKNNLARRAIEKEWERKYGEYQVVKEPSWTPTWKKIAPNSEYFEGTIKFENIEQMAEFRLKDLTVIRIRIVYSDGSTRDFTSY